MKQINTSTFSFPTMRLGDYLYVDKTAKILQLAGGYSGQFFLSRPRRFGKSLLISTLQCLFEGRRELFTGLAIEPQWDWSKKWPVIRLDMGSCQADNAAGLCELLIAMLDRIADEKGIAPLSGSSHHGRFSDLCTQLAKSSPDGKIVILIDEYDKPLLGALGTPAVTEIKTVLKAFYSVIKTFEGLQRFAFMTGVSKFSKVSIFSDLNNLVDLTMDARAATLLGYTEKELHESFDEGVAELAAANGMTKEATYEELKLWYDGFRFHAESQSVYNPVSIGRCISSHEFMNYWFETGTPTFLIEMIKDKPVDLDHPFVTADQFSVFEPEHAPALPLLVQTGFLTIKGARGDIREREYELGFPNAEVSDSFSRALVKSFTDVDDVDRTSLLRQMVEALKADDVAEMLDALSVFFANIPANITLKNEKYYQTLFYAVFLLVGARIQCEVVTNRGRADAVVETPGHVYVFEFKLHGSADDAIAQIREKGYAEKYRKCGKPVTLVGAAFDESTRNLAPARIEQL